MHGLDPTSSRLELGGQPIEQLWVSWRIGEEAKVVRGPDNRLPEVMLPDPIDQDAIRQRVTRIGYPTGQLKSPVG